MGFHNGAYATVWEVKPVGDTTTDVRLSTSYKDKNTEEYIQDFGGYVRFYGTANAAKAARLKKKDRIRLTGTDVTTRYDKEKDVEYTNFKCFEFEMADGTGSSGGGGRREVDNGEPNVEDEGELPW